MTDNKIKKIKLNDINNDSRLKERGMTAGIAGNSPQTALEIVDNPIFTGSGLQYMLARLDKEFRDAKKN